jgi:DNA-binding MarR family transcriptional regulator
MIPITEMAMRNLALQISIDGSLNASEHRILAYFIGILPLNLRLEIGHKQIAERLGMSRPQVSRAMRRLEDKLYITKPANKIYKFPDRLKAEKGDQTYDSDKRKRVG